jgi:hypothetical protein
VQVHVQDEAACDSLPCARIFERHDQSVERAEPFAVIGVRVVGSHSPGCRTTPSSSAEYSAAMQPPFVQRTASASSPTRELLDCASARGSPVSIART